METPEKRKSSFGMIVTVLSVLLVVAIGLLITKRPKNDDQATPSPAPAEQTQPAAKPEQSNSAPRPGPSNDEQVTVVSLAAVSNNGSSGVIFAKVHSTFVAQIIPGNMPVAPSVKNQSSQ